MHRAGGKRNIVDMNKNILVAILLLVMAVTTFFAMWSAPKGSQPVTPLAAPPEDGQVQAVPQ